MTDDELIIELSKPFYSSKEYADYIAKIDMPEAIARLLGRDNNTALQNACLRALAMQYGV